MRVASWNINNIVKRLDLLCDWLARTRPDVVALQELKTPSSEFPAAALREAGYESLVVGQRSWNGVALLARGSEPLPVLTSLPGDAKDKEARYVEAAINGVLFGCLYLPNGNPFPGPKFDYKLRWFERLRLRAEELRASGQPVVLLGDWNVVPTDADIYKPDTWRDNALLQPAPREVFASILAQGWTDVLRELHPAKAPFTFWDYRRKRWQRDAGLRIDHILVSAQLHATDAGVDREERGRENPSDHAPVWAELCTTKSDPLARYKQKRDFDKTSEPAGTLSKGNTKAESLLQFVIQKHWASRLHYDFRLELDGAMLSWAVPKGPSFDPALKQMAIRVEEHPLGYNSFEGKIPKGQYGGGDVMVWDRGTWEPQADPAAGLKAGKLVFLLHGQKLAGLWELVRISKPGQGKQEQWLLFKKRGDAWARPKSEFDVITALPDSVVDKPLGLVEEREPERVRSSGARAQAGTFEPDLSQALRAPQPDKLDPQLATLASSAPARGSWIVENKFDGYRILARIRGGEPRLFTRNGHDWTDKLKPVAERVGQLGIESAWLDGEIAILNASGVPDFSALQNAIDSRHSAEIVYFLFDVPYLGDQDLRSVPLASRRAVLERLLQGSSSEHLRFSAAFDAAPAVVLEAACRLGLEGVILKRVDAPYSSGRSETWLKLKCSRRQEFVVIGFTDRAGAPAEVGSMLLGYYVDAVLHFAGSVGTGWNSATGRDLHAQLRKLETEKPPLDPSETKPGRWSRRAPSGERWVKPKMVVEVAFTEWTQDGKVRHSSFQGVRSDKPARSITRELAIVPEQSQVPGTRARAAAKPIKISNPERVIDPSTGLTKADLVHYYESIAEWMLPHLRNRPCSLVRAPDGVSGPQFFQKHPESKMPGLTELDPDLWPGHASLLAVDTASALADAAQMNVVEFHPWNSTAKKIDRPDRFILDLDPGEGVGWEHVKEAALLCRALLQELGLRCWLKTSGGKGLHVVVPIGPQLSHGEVKDFSQAVVQHMARTIPQRFVSKSGPANRKGKIFIDYLRNGHGQTTAAAFSARARPGLGVSMPVDWEQLKDIRSGAQWTIANAREYISFQKSDPWAEFWKSLQRLTRARRILGANDER